MTARPEFLKIAFVFVFVAETCDVHAQVYDSGQKASRNVQINTNQTQSADRSLGWGSNIQNARLARAAQLALQHGDHALAFDYARRAAQSAPNDPQLWLLLGYAARLDGKLQESVDAYSRGLRLSSSLDGLSGLAQTYRLMGRTEDAERLLKQILASDPRRRDDALLLGDLYMKSADYVEALDWLGRAERIKPDARSELLMAISYQRLKQIDLANHYLQLANQHAPDNPDVQRSMAGYYRDIGNYTEAIAALKSIRNPKPDVTAELAYTFQLNGALEDSARLYAQAANAAPKNLGLQLSAAQAEADIGSLDLANSFLQRAAILDANHYRLHAIRGQIARIQDRKADAVREYSVAMANLPSDPAEGPLYGIQLRMDLLELYKGMMDEGAVQHQLEMAQTEINALGNHVPAGTQFLRLRALIKMNAGDLNGALEDIALAVNNNAKDRASLQLNGDILMKLGRTEAAIAAYKQILVMDSVNRFALTSLGYASRAAGRDLDAEDYFQRATQADPGLYTPHLALGDLFTARREFGRAQDAYGKGYALAPEKALIVAGGMNAAIEAHNLGLAATWQDRITHEMEREPQVLREKERYLRLKGEYQESAAVGREAIKVLPRDRDVVVYLGYDLLHLEKEDELLDLTSTYYNAFPKDPDIPLLQGYVHKRRGLSEQAKQNFTDALDRDPEVVTAYVNRGYMLNDLQQPEAAAADFESALKRKPDDGEAHLGLAYADLGLHKPVEALRQTELAEQALGDSRDIHVIRATAYGRQNLLIKSASEYEAALSFTPNDGSLRLGLGNTLFAQRRYRDAVDQLQMAMTDSPNNAEIHALLARSYAVLQDRDQALRHIQKAEELVQLMPTNSNALESRQSEIFVSTGDALSTLGDEKAAMERFRKALIAPGSNRLDVRLAIAQLDAQRGHSTDAQRQIVLALMEAEAGETAPPVGNQFIAAADVFRVVHEYQLSQTFLQRAKSAGAPDAKVRVGLANNFLAIGDTVRAHAELLAVSADADSAADYQYLLAKANVLRQQHNGEEALTAFAQASDAGGEDRTAERDLLQAGADEGLRVTPTVSVLSDFSMGPIFEDTTVYVLDAKLDAPFPVTSSEVSLLPLPRSSLETQSTSAYHLHFDYLPTFSGFFQLRNSRGQISVPSTNSVVNRNTTDYAANFGINPTFSLGSSVLAFNTGIQGTFRRDSVSPVEMNQNLFRAYTYMSTSSLFNMVAASGYAIWEGGPFTESNLHSRALAGALDFRVGAPWSRTALVTGWGVNDQQFSPVNDENYYTSSYVGIEHRFSDRLGFKALVEDLRAWRVVGTNSGIAQTLRPAGTVEIDPTPNWSLKVSSAYSSTRSFHVYDAIQTGFSVSYAMPLRRRFNDGSKEVALQYPIRFSAGLQHESFFNFTGGHNQQFRPYVRISLF